mmetsp:Transcript_118474/g.335050  ORF Transcript_118474/g.335050 Transcript_118474/m.335050 type:complete len:209 (+) Transcript_118474:110-736(+)
MQLGKRTHSESSCLAQTAARTLCHVRGWDLRHVDKVNNCSAPVRTDIRVQPAPPRHGLCSMSSSRLRCVASYSARKASERDLASCPSALRLSKAVWCSALVFLVASTAARSSSTLASSPRSKPSGLSLARGGVDCVDLTCAFTTHSSWSRSRSFIVCFRASSCCLRAARSADSCACLAVSSSSAALAPAVSPGLACKLRIASIFALRR